MSRSRGKRYDEEPKLNIKKVIAFILAVVAIMMSVISLIKLFKNGSEPKNFISTNEYLPIYTNDKWGVINSKGQVIIPAMYNEMIIIPDKSKPVFICTYEADYNNETYKTKVLNDENNEILQQFNQVEAIDNYNEKMEIWYEANVLRYKQNDKYGLIDFSGKVILNPEYDNIYALKGVERSIIIEKENKKGLLNNITGEIIIEPIYSDILPVGNTYDGGYIVKNESGQVGIIGPDKKVILETKYEDILNIAGNNMYIIKEEQNEKLINNRGEVLLEEITGKAVSINGDNLVVKQNDLYGIINSKGIQKVDYIYENISYAFTDCYIAKKDGKVGIINENGENKTDFIYNSITYVKAANIFKAEKENFETDIIDKDFKVRLIGIVSELNTEKGYIRIRQDGEYKYYNFNFEEKNNRDILTGNTLFLVKNNGKYGYQNKKGELVVDYIYDDATEQNKYGFCSVKKDGLWGSLKSDGTVVVNPSKNLDRNLYIDFIGEWYLHEDLDLNIYTK